MSRGARGGERGEQGRRDTVGGFKLLGDDVVVPSWANGAQPTGPSRPPSPPLPARAACAPPLQLRWVQPPAEPRAALPPHLRPPHASVSAGPCPCCLCTRRSSGVSCWANHCTSCLRRQPRPAPRRTSEQSCGQAVDGRQAWQGGGGRGWGGGHGPRRACLSLPALPPPFLPVQHEGHPPRPGLFQPQGVHARGPNPARV